jgi:hypothetical protein
MDVISMRVQFEFTPDDLIDASRRFLARSKVVASWRWKGLGYSAFFIWLLVFTLCTYFYRRPVMGALIGLVAAGLSALMYPSSHRKAVEKRLLKFNRERFGEANSFLCEVELTAEGVWVRAMNLQVVYEWASVEEIQETSDSVDIFTRDGGGVVVRNRAFETPADKKAFLELARASLTVATKDRITELTRMK